MKDSEPDELAEATLEHRAGITALTGILGWSGRQLKTMAFPGTATSAQLLDLQARTACFIAAIPVDGEG